MKTKQASVKWVECRESKIKSGSVYGYIELFWCESGQRYVSIPGLTRFKELYGTIRAI